MKMLQLTTCSVRRFLSYQDELMYVKFVVYDRGSLIFK
ncbi:hypothetical protein SJAV_26680 [Sulfurisphaera javensis]|uniref:Uncharacterized protein n=1 Tax=Sulfurisphaera javensis TaxID=2049879 RepID=A0AAT9GV75_9CREN